MTRRSDLTVADLRPLSLFEGLTDDQLSQLVAVGTKVDLTPGVALFHEGDPADFWWVLLSGAVDLVRHVGHEDVVVGKMDHAGVWAGGFRAWDEHGTYLASAVGTSAGRVLRVPAPALRERSSLWFPFAAHLIEGVYRTARTIESTARQRESLVTLGTLAAGLAHELNNPAAAATRSVDALEIANASLLSALRELAQADMSAAQFTALDELRRSIRPRAHPPDPVTRADEEESVALWLEGHGVGQAWEIAAQLAAAGVDLPWCERAADVLDAGTLGPGVAWLASSFAAAALLAEVKESTRRVSDLVSAVRSYSQLDRASLQDVDVTEGLESTLVMLGHKLRGGVTVLRDFGVVPRITAYPGELNQVWTNLIDNAVDAMDGVGTLRLVTRAGDGLVVVEVCDTGPGMTGQVAARAFEPFYSTKGVGKGTGLGLDIARRIVVERHGGSIEIDSRPGTTVLRVTLPVMSRPSVS